MTQDTGGKNEEDNMRAENVGHIAQDSQVRAEAGHGVRKDDGRTKERRKLIKGGK